MTTHREKECAHCGDRYYYQASGPGCDHKLNDSTYCPNCREAIVEALSKIPIKWERCWIPTDDFSLKQLQEIEQETIEKAKQENELIARRVSLPLFNINTGESDVTGIVRHPTTGKFYEYRYWRGKEDEAEITVEVDKHTETGEIRYRTKLYY